MLTLRLRYSHATRGGIPIRRFLHRHPPHNAPSATKRATDFVLRWPSGCSTGHWWHSCCPVSNGSLQSAGLQPTSTPVLLQLVGEADVWKHSQDNVFFKKSVIWTVWMLMFYVVFRFYWLVNLNSTVVFLGIAYIQQSVAKNLGFLIPFTSVLLALIAIHMMRNKLTYKPGKGRGGNANP